MERRISESGRARPFLAPLLFVAILVLGDVAMAAPDEATLSAARSKLADGVELMKKGDAAGALMHFDQAYALVPSPKIFFDLGLAHDALGQNAQALTAFTRFVEETESPNAASLAKARERIAMLKSLVASVTVICDVAGASVEIDGTSAGTTPLHGLVFVEPGDHVFVATAGPQTGRKKFAAVAGRKVDVTLELSLPPPNPPPAKIVAPPPDLSTIITPVTNPDAANPPRDASTAARVAQDEPKLLEQQGQNPADQPERRPVYRRAWFWGAVAAAVVAGTVAVVLAGQSSSAPSAPMGSVRAN